MNKMMITGLLACAAMLFVSSFSFAQRGYTEFSNEENLRIMYRWQRSIPLQPESDAVLNLRVTNNNDYPVMWTYTVGFYQDGVLVFQSESYELCLTKGQSRRGGLAGLRFSVEDMTLADTEKEGFSWEFGAFDVEQLESCK